MTAPSNDRTRTRAARRQRGVYAVEYALVFPIFFVLIYAVLSYGIVFAVRLGMQNAAEDGARAGLRYCTPALTCREAAARTVAQSRVDWLPAVAAPVARTCPIGVDCAVSVTSCGTTLPTRCQIVVTIDYDYASNPIAPPLPGFGFLLPDKLQGRASVLLVDGNV